jgi:UDP-N-acetylmuramyl tripeptide synthase
MRLDLQNLAERETCEFPGFNEKLLQVLPGLREHHCARGHAGGFVERLQEGTYFSHTVEHVALELTDAVEISVNRGKTVWSGTPGVYLVAVEYKSEAAMRKLLYTAVDLVEALLRGEEFDLDTRIREAKAVAPDCKLAPSTRAIVAAADRRGIPWVRVDGGNALRLGYGKYRRYVEGTIADKAQFQAGDVASAIVDMLYPPGTASRIPIVSITGTNGKTTVTRMIGHILAQSGRSVGMTTTEGIWIRGEQVECGDTTGPWSAGVVLSDDCVDVAVLETARGGLFRAGLGYDWSDVSVMTNIELDHIGQDGIETIEDIVWIKQLVAERVREGGTLVLNADDERLVELSRKERILRVPKRIVFFSLRAENPVVADHVRSGGTAYALRGDWIVELTPEGEAPLAKINDIPVCLGGLAGFQTANAMAALAAVRAIGVDRKVAAEALQQFQSDRNNAGRMNLYCVNDRYILLDYGHNPAALQAICDLVTRWPAGKAIGVVGLPGDRSDSLLAESARVAGCGFDAVVIREDKDLRGRSPGEMPELLRRVISEAYPELPLEVVPDEVEAIRYAMSLTNEGDVVVVFAEKVAEAVQTIAGMGGEPVSQLRSLTS